MDVQKVSDTTDILNLCNLLFKILIPGNYIQVHNRM